MKISIVIRTYNEGRHVGKLLYGIREQSLQPHEVILVDSGSTDDTVEIAKSYGAKIVNIRKDIFTFGRSLNIGIAAAEGDIIVIVSGHVYPVSTEWLAELCAPLGEHGVVLAYGKQRGNNLTKFSEHRVFERWFPDKSVAIQDGVFCNNANCAILKSEWEKEPYDEDLTGLEDLDWAKKSKARGGKIAYCAEACIIHVHEETWKGVHNRYRREAMAFKVINPEAVFTFWDFIYCLFSNIFHDVIASLRSKNGLSMIGEIYNFRLNQFYGTYLGYNKKVSGNELKERFYYPKVTQGEALVGPGRGHLINYSYVPSHAESEAHQRSASSTL